MNVREGFTLDLASMRVRLRSGAVDDLGGELDHLRLGRVLVLSTPHEEKLAREVAGRLGDRVVGVYPHARIHVPIDVAERAIAHAVEVRADGCLAIGGGSTIGLGKAIALKSGLPIVAVPTTYAGSEMTSIWGMTEGGRKRTGRDSRVRPVSVVYDPDLSSTLPMGISAASGMNAIAHAVEAVYAPDRSPLVSMMAERGVSLLASALPALLRDGRDPCARHDALEAAWLCGVCLGATTMGLHHNLCHVLGGTFDLPHAETHAIVLPHVARFNLEVAPHARSLLERALETDDVPQRLQELNAQLGLPARLGDLGLSMTAVDQIVKQVLTDSYANPRPAGEPDLRALVAAMI